MAKFARDTNAGKSISAYIVLDKKGRHVATVNAYFPDSGGCTVDVWNHIDGADKCLAAALKCGAVSKTAFAKTIAESEKARASWGAQDHYSLAAHDTFGVQQSRGNDLAGALAGLFIDGVRLADHSGKSEQTDKLLKAYQRAATTVGRAENNREFQKPWDAKAARIGAYFANYSSTYAAYSSLFHFAGLDRLSHDGYQVIQAI